MLREFICTIPSQIDAHVQTMKNGLAMGPVVVAYGRPNRSDDQNKKLWASANDIANQVKWNGDYLSKDEWVTLFTAVVTKTKLLQGLEGGVVPAVRSTRRLTKQECADVIEYMYAFGADNDVVFNDAD